MKRVTKVVGMGVALGIGFAIGGLLACLLIKHYIEDHAVIESYIPAYTSSLSVDVGHTNAIFEAKDVQPVASYKYVQLTTSDASVQWGDSPQQAGLNKGAAL